MADIELVIKIPESLYNFVRSKTSAGNSRNFDDYDMYDVSRRIANGTPIPEHHGDLKDIGNMELLNVQVHDDYSKGWHNAIEYCVRQLRERTTIIPATKEGDGGMREATKEERESINNYIKSISQKVITIPDEATNGDVIKALFPNAIYEHINKRGVGFTRVRPNAFEFPQDFHDDWWNEPYKESKKE